MNDPFDAMVAKLQEQIFDETKEAFGEAGFQRWRNPLYNKKFENADAHASVTGRCGDTMTIDLKFIDDCVSDASFSTDGCGSSTICGSFAAEMTIGKSCDALSGITGESILKKIGRFPKEDEHCAFLAAQTLQEALNNFMMENRKK